MVATNVTIETQGRFFQDPNSPLRRHMENGVKQLVEMGEERLAQMLRPRPAGVYLSVAEAKKGQASTGHYRANLNTRVSGLHGLITDGGVIYGPWLEGISSRNQTTRFKGYSSFRRTGQWLQQQAEPVFQRHIGRYVQEINQ